MTLAFSADTRITILLVLALIAAGAVFWAVGEHVGRRFAQAKDSAEQARKPGDPKPEHERFDSRFPEKSKYVVEELIVLAQNKDLSSYYRSPVLFPADLLVMILLTVAMGAASFFWLGRLAGPWAWAGLLFPIAYFLFDLAEDCLLYRMLGDPGTIRDRVGTLMNLTRGKFVTIVASVVQTLGLLVAYLIAACRGAAG